MVERAQDAADRYTWSASSLSDQLIGSAPRRVTTMSTRHVLVLTATFVAAGPLASPARAQAPDPAPPAADPAPPAQEPAPPDKAPGASTTPAEQPAPTPPAPDAKVALHGTVIGEDHTPQAGAGVSIAALGLYVLTDDKGEYTMSVPPGPHVVRVDAAGQIPIEKTVVVGATPALLDFQLAEGALGEVITIIGSRTPRSRLETSVPVDVITNEVIAESNYTETNQILNTIAPSFNASHLSITDGTDHIDPADLRSLGPEHVLVLINGKRLHQSSLINVYNGGTVGIDLNAIPTSAIARIEVLRDGAASQYGSDAIAGVINIVLKETVDVVNLYTLTGITAAGDGAQIKLGGNTGFKLGERGFVNVTGEFLSRGRTNRAKPWPADIFTGITGTAATDAELARRGLTRDDFKMDVGTAGALVGTGFLNAGYKLDETLELHAQAGYTWRKGYASGFYRLPNEDFEPRSNLTIYPNGFLPQINPVLNAYTATAGVRGKTGPWQGDLSLTYGGDSFHFLIDHSLNASLGTMSPTSFDAGKLNLNQTSLNLDGVRRIDQDALKSLAVVGGGEIRRENYSINAGQPESYELGPELDSAGNPKSPGSQVFPGFRPSDESNNSRLSEAIYTGVESQPTASTNLDLGARFEHYSDFGNTVTGKIAGRLTAVKTSDLELAFRGSASTGFRAPGLQQIYYSTIATQFVNDPATNMIVPNNVLISPNRSDVTSRAFGVPHLKEETSVNFSGGFTARLLGNLSLSTDYYHVTLKDRVVLSALFSVDDTTDMNKFGDAVAAILQPFPGVSAAQFFVNAVDTTTDGADVVLDYSYRLPQGTVKATAAANFTRTTVDEVRVPQSMQERFSSVMGGADRVKELFLGRYGKNLLEDLLPHRKATLGLRWDSAAWLAGVRASYFGPSKYHSDSGPELDESYGSKVIFDADVGYRFRGLTFIVGASNLLNTFPDEMKHEDNRYNDSFLYSPASVPAGTPFGTDGGFYYLRVEYQR
jgi:iron complex outermembrane receptor protein